MHALYSKLKLKRGFTLVEVLIVILIIALLMAFIIPQVLKGPAAARDATRISHLGQIAVALEGYRSGSARVYPDGGDHCILPTSPIGQLLITGGYLSRENFPQDPDKKNAVSGNSCQGGYYYTTVNNGNGFMVFAKLETPGRSNADQADLNKSTVDNNARFNSSQQGGFYFVSSGL